MFVAAILQVTIFSQIDILGGYPDVVLLTLVAVALLRGSIYGAAAGFFAGLIVDTANLATLGVTSLLLTIAGYWIGRYGETTGRDRAHAPYVSVAVATILVQFGALILHYLLGDTVSAKAVLIETLPPKVALNLLLTLPVYALDAAAARGGAAGRDGDGGAPPWLAPARAAVARGPTASCRPTRGSRARIASLRSSRCGSGSSLPSRCSRSACSSSGSGRCRCSPGRSTCRRRSTTRSARSASRRRAARSSTAKAGRS